jgi:hypothetical protein
VVAAVAVTVVDVVAVAVVVVTAVAAAAVIAITIVTSANPAGSNSGPQIRVHSRNLWPYFLASGVIFKLNFSPALITSITYS